MFAEVHWCRAHAGKEQQIRGAWLPGSGATRENKDKLSQYQRFSLRKGALPVDSLSRSESVFRKPICQQYLQVHQNPMSAGDRK